LGVWRVILSLNEIEASILKAARGAGMEWGLAEEAAQAAGWLARQRIGFEAAFLDLLDIAPWRAEIVLDGELLRPRNPGAWICPVRAGACLSDLAGAAWRIERVVQPLLLLPFAARLEAPFSLIWDDVSLSAWGSRIVARPNDVRAGPGDRAKRVELITSETVVAAEVAAVQDDGVDIDAALWAKFRALEMRTYVPASLHSRLSGAGSAAGDND
jgi:hypothetical protein